MNQKIEITNKQWLDTQSKLNAIEVDVKTIKRQLEEQEKDINYLNTQYTNFRIALGNTIKDEINPVMKQVTKLSEENARLSKELEVSKNEKLQEAYKLQRHIIYLLVGGFVTYVFGLVYANIFL